jgi:hypothetical protein
MPVVIERMTTTLEIQDEVRIRRLVREEICRILDERDRTETSRRDERVDPRDPAAGSRPRFG